jgi:hypothetical protein
MKSFALLAAICAVALSAAATQAAKAATTTYRINFTASGPFITNCYFSLPPCGVPPVDPVKGTVYLTFDPAVKKIIKLGTTITGSTNLANTKNHLIFEYDPTQNGGYLAVCGGGCGVGGVFTLNIVNFLSSPSFEAPFLYWQPVYPKANFVGYNGSVTCAKPGLKCGLLNGLYRCQRTLRPCP